jgi:mono/diheme cytochrome c family protein
MKFRITFLIVLASLLTACNFTLAEDVTPPPDYIPPTPMPALGPLYPGAAIYVEKCAPCHGDTGLGDGEKGIQLGVTVRAFGLPEIARAASPAQYYTSVTRGNIERFMPPFNSLNNQQRWDVVSYVLTLHTTPEQIAKGKELFDANCANCSTDFFKNQEKMSELSAVDLARLIRQGSSEVPAFGANLEDNDLWAVAAYLRTLSFDFAPLAQPTTVSATQTPVAADAGTPSAEGTPVGTTQAQAGPQGEATSAVQKGFGTVSGSIENKTGAGLPSDLVITLRGFDHSSTDPSAGPQEVFSETGVVNADGTYTFENIELTEGLIYLVEAEYSGISLQSEFGIVEAGQSALTLAPIVLYKITKDTSALAIDQLHMFVQTSGEDKLEVLALYTFRNTGDAIITVELTSQQTEIPFLKFLQGSEGLGYEATQDSAPFISMNNGFAMAPNETPYGILAYSSITKAKETTITQEFSLPATAVRIFLPDGMEAQGDTLTAEGSQDVQGTIYQPYIANDLKAGDTLTFTVSGTPKVTETENTTTSSNNMLLIAAGGLGVGLILVGAWLYYRDRKRTQADDEEDDDEGDEGNEFGSSEEVLDAILALDDLHRAKKITEDAYQKRRAELKEILKGMM